MLPKATTAGLELGLRLQWIPLRPLALGMADYHTAVVGPFGYGLQTKTSDQARYFFPKYYNEPPRETGNHHRRHSLRISKLTRTTTHRLEMPALLAPTLSKVAWRSSKGRGRPTCRGLEQAMAGVLCCCWCRGCTRVAGIACKSPEALGEQRRCQCREFPCCFHPVVAPLVGGSRRAVAP